MSSRIFEQFVDYCISNVDRYQTEHKDIIKKNIINPLIYMFTKELTPFMLFVVVILGVNLLVSIACLVLCLSKR